MLTATPHYALLCFPNKVVVKDYLKLYTFTVCVLTFFLYFMQHSPIQFTKLVPQACCHFEIPIFLLDI